MSVQAIRNTTKHLFNSVDGKLLSTTCFGPQVAIVRLALFGNVQLWLLSCVPDGLHTHFTLRSTDRDDSHYAVSFTTLSRGISQLQILSASYSLTINIQYYHFLCSFSLLIHTLLKPYETFQ
jgi:hypothetical protein